MRDLLHHGGSLRGMHARMSLGASGTTRARGSCVLHGGGHDLSDGLHERLLVNLHRALLGALGVVARDSVVRMHMLTNGWGMSLHLC